jgi:hypothetical protein
MSTKANETLQDAVLGLRDWLKYLDDREREFTEQLERARRKGAATSEEGENPPPTGSRDGWL